MCGIAGYVGNGDLQLLKRMCETMQHRGPDDEGFWVGDGVGLGHRRLSIIDLATGHQPMCNEDQTVWIAFNGEVYNCRELGDELQIKGHTFKTKSDTESVVHAYEEYGCDCIEHLRGCFAFAIWDDNRRQLLLATDRFGQKPLYYSAGDGRISFASEFRALCQDPAISSELNMTALGEYLRLGYVPAPYSIFEDISKLAAGRFLLWKEGDFGLTRYWQPQFVPKVHLTEEEAGEQVLSLLREAVRIRLVSDVPLGVCLSGGIDSSIIVALMAQMCDAPVQTFTMGFEVEAFDERSYARQISEAFGTNHHEFVADPNVADLLPKLARYYGEPYADDSAVPTYYLAQEVSKHVKVALVGDGGDELFAGYLRLPRIIGQPTGTDSHRAIIRRALERLPMGLRRSVSRIGVAALSLVGDSGRRSKLHDGFSYLGMSLSERYWSHRDLLTDGASRSVFSEEFRRQVFDVPSPTEEWLLTLFEDQAMAPLDRLLAVEMAVPLPDGLCVKMDIATMAHGLEARAPLLDHKLAEFVNSLAPDLKLRNGTTKYLLKRAFGDILPRNLLSRPKQGFSIPCAKWLAVDLREYMRDILFSPEAQSRGYYDEQQLARVVDEHLSRDFDHSCLLWRLLMLEIWFQTTFPLSLPSG